MHSWRVLLLPFIDQKELYKQYNFDEPWDSPENRKLLDQRPAIYSIHDLDKMSGSEANYLVVVGKNTAWPTNGSIRFDDISDGTENTILVVENIGSGIHWTQPADLNFDSMSFDLASSPPNGISSRYLPAGAVLADGSLHTLSASEFPPARLRAMVTANTGDDPLLDTATTIEDGRDRPLRLDSESTE